MSLYTNRLHIIYTYICSCIANIKYYRLTIDTEWHLNKKLNSIMLSKKISFIG